eukprot:2327911-Amphidinium_carterae.1
MQVQLALGRGGELKNKRVPKLTGLSHSWRQLRNCEIVTRETLYKLGPKSETMFIKHTDVQQTLRYELPNKMRELMQTTIPTKTFTHLIPERTKGNESAKKYKCNLMRNSRRTSESQ